jgi:hypothetical protein
LPKCCCSTGRGGEEVPERFGEGHEEHEEQEQQEQEQQTAQSPQEEKFRQGEQIIRFFRVLGTDKQSYGSGFSISSESGIRIRMQSGSRVLI